MTPWLISLFTVLAVYFLDRWENRHLQSLFDWVPAILLAYLIPALVSYALDADYSQADIHRFSRDLFIPLAIISVMASLSIGQLKAIGWKPILLFLSGSFFIALFPVLMLLGISESDLVSNTMLQGEYWKGIPPIVGSWIGGSTSQLVLKELVECPEHVFLSVLVMDNVLVNIWTILMFQAIKKSGYLNGLFRISDLTMPEDLRAEAKNPLSPWYCSAIMIMAIAICHVSNASFVGKVVVLSMVGLALSNFIPKWNFRFSLKMGGVLILVVMAVLGLKLQFATLGFNSAFLAFLIIWILAHFIFMVLTAKVLNVNMAWVPIASMANVGGIATAPAVTAAYEKKWMPHAIVLAILSMATGTFWGMFTIYLLQAFLV